MSIKTVLCGVKPYDMCLKAFDKQAFEGVRYRKK